MLRIVLTLLALPALLTSAASAAEQRPKSALELILAEETDRPETAVRDYAGFVAAHSPPRSEFETIEVAIALHNRGIVLTRLGRTAEAKQSYQALEDGFAASVIPIVRLQVAKSLLNLAFLNLEDGRYRATIAYAQKVDVRYSGAEDGDLGDDGFDLQILKALNDKADAWYRLGFTSTALAICDEIFRRFGAAKNAQMRAALDVTGDLQRRVKFVPENFGTAPLPR